MNINYEAVPMTLDVFRLNVTLQLRATPVSVPCRASRCGSTFYFIVLAIMTMRQSLNLNRNSWTRTHPSFIRHYKQEEKKSLLYISTTIAYLSDFVSFHIWRITKSANRKSKSRSVLIGDASHSSCLN
jgi:hypothetical protein